MSTFELLIGLMLNEIYNVLDGSKKQLRLVSMLNLINTLMDLVNQESFTATGLV